MYLWKVNKLVDDLSNDDVSEYESLKYIVFMGVLYTLATDPLFTVGLEYTVVDAITTLVVVVTTVLGTIYCFKRNSAGDNKNFALRYVCLSVPVSIRVLLISLPIIMVVAALTTPDWPGFDSVEPLDETYKSDPEFVFVLAFIEIFYFWYLGHAIRKVASNQNT